MKKIIFGVLILIALSGTVRAQNPSVLLGQKVESGNSFEIQGTITSVNDSSFIVRGELVAVSSEKMSRFKSNRLLETGNFVKVTGEIKNNILMAEDIDVLGKNPEIETSLPHPTIIDQDILGGIISAIKNIIFQ